ncbi:sugar phosphate isomerase/epimerase family protein [uncultured Agathobaculum sp.]|uniref:sugar phosphate isomerase/epimerase family protein n=1 Tax=uncultured Agathobaculum sp. TaxID=2048140 RepID=UPI0032084A6D
MFKIAGHTMGTPEYTVCEAIELMHRIGADGIEIVVQDDYCSGLPCDCDENTLSEVKQCAEKNGIQIICLTPYNSYFNSLDETVRQREIAAIKKVIGYCDYLGAKYIRIYGGNLAAGDTEKLTERCAKLVESMRELGDAAAEKGVTLVIENHFNTMAVSAKESASLIEEIDHPAVRILYDQANLTFAENECYEEAIPVQQKYVKYIHVKDLVFKEGVAFSSSNVAHPDESERNVYTRIVGEGVVPWPQILRAVKERGYDGWLSLEYERRWHPDDIPDASIGMKKSLEYLRQIQF